MIITARRHKVTIDEIDESYFCKEDQHLLAGMASIGKRGIPSGCHGGGCGVCKIKIVEGDYKTLVMSRDYISQEEEENNCALACRVFPKSEIRLQVLGKMSKNVLKPEVKKKYGFV